MGSHRLRTFGVAFLLIALVGPLSGALPARGRAAAPATGTSVSPLAPAAAAVFGADGAHLAPGVTLRLAAVGRGDLLTPVDTVTPTDNGTRAEYAHGNATEWYIRQGGGVEQGVTFAARPVGDGPLALTIATPGAVPLVNETGDAATLLVPGAVSDAARWQYDGLHVTDAAGRTLPARLAAVPDGMRITADDRGAVYPVTVDPYAQRQVIYPANGNLYTIALSADGSTLIVLSSGFGFGVSTVYVYVRSGGVFATTPAVTLTDPGPPPMFGNNNFGSAVAVSATGGIIAIGASNTTSSQGVAYVYARGNGGGYSNTPTTTLADAPTATSYDAFGSALALSGDGNTLVVGASGRTSNQGAAFVYTKATGGVFSNPPVTTIPDPPAATNNDRFGTRIVLNADNGNADDGTTLVISATGRTGYQGAAYVFTRPANGSFGTAPAATLPDPGATTNDNFGYQLAISGDGSTLVVGESNLNGSRGAAYIYARSNGSFAATPTVTLADPGGVSGDNFGGAVAVNADGSTVVIGALGISRSRGAVYTYLRGSGNYSAFTAMPDPLNTTGDNFGNTLALSADAGTLVATGASNTGLFVFGIPTTLTPLSGTTPQSATVNTGFGTPLAVTVTDNNGVPLSGASVTFSVQSLGTDPGGSFAGSASATAVSDANGVATAPAFTANTTAGTYTVTATTSGVLQTFTLTNTAGALAALVTRPGTTPQNAAVTTAFGTLAVTATDVYGNPVSGVSVSFSAPPSGASGTFASSASVTTGTNGIATASTFTADTLAGNYTVSASTLSIGGTAQFSLTNIAGAAASIVALGGNGGSAQIGQPFAVPLKAQVRDAYGNPVGGGSVTFTAPPGAGGTVATATFPNGGVATADLTGVASLTPTAAGRPGTFVATASAAGASVGFTLVNTAAPNTVLVTGFSPPTGPTSGGNVVTLRGVNFGGATSVTFDTSNGTAITVVNATTITVTAPAHAAGTVDVVVVTNGQTARIHGYTYLDSGNIAPQPPTHPLPGSGGPGPMVQPGRHDDAGGSGGSGGNAPQAITPTPAPQPGRH